MPREKRIFSAEERATILRRHLADKVPVSDLCDEYKIQPSLFYTWQRQAMENLSAALEDRRTRRAESNESAAQKQAIKKLEGQLSWLQPRRHEHRASAYQERQRVRRTNEQLMVATACHWHWSLR